MLCYHNIHVYIFRSHGNQLLGLLRDMETLLASDSHFLLGNWIKAATDNAMDMQDSWFLQFNARNQITLWGPRGEVTLFFSIINQSDIYR